MVTITPTRELAYAAGTDAAHRRMRAEGRDAWNQADLDIAGATYTRIMGRDLFVSGHAWRDFGVVRASWRCKWCGVKRTDAARETVCEGK